MRPPFYMRQLKQDLEMWIQKGLVPAENRDAILQSVSTGSAVGRLETIIAVFGAILIGAGALSFVGANWAAMTKAARLFVLFGGMSLAYGIAIWFHHQGRAAIGQAFVLLGVLLFGANIWLIAQTYNINSHYPDGLLMWGLGALAAAYLVPSLASLGAALVIGGYWTFLETTGNDSVLHLPFLAYWAACAGLAGAMNWRPGIHLSALSFIFWLVISYEPFRHILGWGNSEILSIYVLVPLAAWSVSQSLDRGKSGIAFTAGHYAFFIFLVAFAVLHFTDGDAGQVSSTWLVFAAGMSLVSLAGILVAMNRGNGTLLDLGGTAFSLLATVSYIPLVTKSDDQFDIPYQISTLLVILWSLTRGARLDDRFVINWSIVAFGAWVLYAYFDLFAGLMDQAVFFTAGGILLIVLALGLEPLRRRLVAGSGKPAAAGDKS